MTVKEAEENACARFLIELAFVFPPETDLTNHPLTLALLDYVAAIRSAATAVEPSD